MILQYSELSKAIVIWLLGNNVTNIWRPNAKVSTLIRFKNIQMLWLQNVFPLKAYGSSLVLSNLILSKYINQWTTNSNSSIVIS